MDAKQREAVRAQLWQWLDRLEREGRSQVAQVEPKDCRALSELLRAELTGTLPPSAGAGSFLPAPGTTPLPDASEPSAGEPSAVPHVHDDDRHGLREDCPDCIDAPVRVPSPQTRR